MPLSGRPLRRRIVDPLRFREVLDRTRSDCDLQGLSTRGRLFPSEPLLSSEVLRNPHIMRFAGI
jgi:hypothetical protein